jgi:hypothetical protein
MGEFINIGEIDNILCDKSLRNELFYLSSNSRIFNESTNSIELIYKNLIKSKKYQEVRASIVSNQINYLENDEDFGETKSRFIFDYELAENLLELMSSYHIMLTNEGMCNLMLYIFYDVYCAKKNFDPYYGFATAEQNFDSFIPSKWNWQNNAVFKGINEDVYYRVNAKKFWTNFSQVLLQKLGSVFIQLITHNSYSGLNIVESFNDNFFIIKTSAGPPDEPWYVADLFSRILETHEENAKDSSGIFFTNSLYSSNPLPDFYKSETDKWKPDCGINLYSPGQRKAYGVFQKLKELDISTKNILNGTVNIFENPN